MENQRVVAVTRPKRERRQPETVWLDDDQQRAWRQLLSMLMELPAALESDLQRTTGLTSFEYLVLANLSEANDRTLRMSELASSANSSLSRLSHVVGRLAGDGLVVKRVCADDGRVSVVELTKAGMRRVSAAAPFARREGARTGGGAVDAGRPDQARPSGPGHYRPDRRVGLAHRVISWLAKSSV